VPADVIMLVMVIGMHTVIVTLTVVLLRVLVVVPLVVLVVVPPMLVVVGEVKVALVVVVFVKPITEMLPTVAVTGAPSPRGFVACWFPLSVATTTLKSELSGHTVGQVNWKSHTPPAGIIIFS